MANDFSQIRVGVDWSNKGVICMGSRPSDPHNLIANSIYYQTHPTFVESGTLTKTYLPAREYPIAGAVRWVWVASPNATMWMFRDSGTTRSLTVAPSTNYTMSIVFRYFSDLSSWSGSFQIMAWNGVTWDVVKSVSSGSNDDEVRFGDTTSIVYRKAQLTFTTGVSHTRLAVRFVSNAYSGNKTLNIYGYMLVAGTYEAPVNGGAELAWNCYADDPLSVQDDVTDYAMSADFSIGKTEWDQALPQEGVATVVLRNDSKKFSPERPEFIGGFIVNRRVWIERYVSAKPGVPGVLLPQLQWSGWVKSLQPKPNIYGERTAALEAQQGWYNIEKIPVSPKIIQSITVGSAMMEALRNGYELPTNPAFAKVGYGLVNNTWLVDPTVLIPNHASGTTLDFIGLYWEDNSNALQIMEELIDFENNWTWMDRYGEIHFIPAATITAASPTEAELSSNQIDDMEYQYGDEIWTGIQADVLFQHFTPVAPENQFPLSDVVEVDIDAGTEISVVVPNTYNNDNSPNDRSYGSHGNQIASAVRLDDLSVPVTVSAPGFGGTVLLGFIGGAFDSRTSTFSYDITYTVLNTNSFPVRFSIQTLGYGWITDFKGQVLQNNNTLSNRYGYHVKQLSNQYLQNEVLAGDYFSRKIARLSNVHGWFPSVKLIAVNDSGMSVNMSKLRVGTCWQVLSEAQVINGFKPMVVIGEQSRWSPQYFEKVVYNSPKF